MDIQALKVVLTEDEANALIAEFLPKDTPVENVRVRLTSEGITVQGEYPVMLMKMAFEALWEVTGSGSELRARLASAKVAGLPAGMLRGVLFKAIRDAATREPAVQVEDEAVRVNLTELEPIKPLKLRLNLTSVRCTDKLLTIEAGPLLA
jgi:hypothetical protein